MVDEELVAAVLADQRHGFIRSFGAEGVVVRPEGMAEGGEKGGELAELGRSDVVELLPLGGDETEGCESALWVVDWAVTAERPRDVVGRVKLEVVTYFPPLLPERFEPLLAVCGGGFVDVWVEKACSAEEDGDGGDVARSLEQ